MTDTKLSKVVAINQSIQNKATNSKFAIEPQLSITQDENGLEYIEIDNALATAKIALQGGHIISWQPKLQEQPVLWVSSNARYEKGRSIRGGVPICWPWFGAHPTDGTLCPHGFARVIPWQLIEAEPTRHGFDHRLGQMRREVVDDDDGLAAAPGRLAAQDDAAHFPHRLRPGRLRGRRRRHRAGR